MINASLAFLQANTRLAKKPIHLISIEGYNRVFTNRRTGIAAQFDWITSIEDLSITVSDMDGGADLGDLTFTVQDGYPNDDGTSPHTLTADFPSFIFEGKRVTLQTGLTGMDQGNFVTLFTGLVSTVQSTNANQEYTFTCTDIRQELTKVVYTLGDDGFPTDSDHPRTLNGHPLDILYTLLTDEIGLTAADIDTAKLLHYREFIYSGTQFQFRLTSPPAAKDFIENELMKPLGAYIWPNNRGKISINSFYPETQNTAGGYGYRGYGNGVVYGGGGGGIASLFRLTTANLTGIPNVEQADLINQVSYRFDQTDDGKFFAESVQSDGASVAKYGLYGQQVIESAGVRSGFQGFFLAQLTSFLIFLRYGDKALQLGGSSDVTAFWDACVLEPGDQVAVSHDQIPDRENGVMGIALRPFEVMDRTYHFDSATVSLKLIDLQNASTFLISRIAPSQLSRYTEGTDAAKTRYLFLAGDDGKYSDGTPAATLA